MLRIKTLTGTTLYVAFVLALAGCSQHNDGNSQSSGATPTTPLSSADTGTAAPSTKSRFTAITPDSHAAAAFNYKVFESAGDGSWISLVPMSPKAGDVVIGINVPGAYEVKLTNEKCASNVNVSPSHGGPFELNAAAPRHLISVNEVTQLKIAMADTAPNNYFCNVAIAVAPQ